MSTLRDVLFLVRKMTQSLSKIAVMPKNEQASVHIV